MDFEIGQDVRFSIEGREGFGTIESIENDTAMVRVFLANEEGTTPTDEVIELTTDALTALNPEGEEREIGDILDELVDAYSRLEGMEEESEEKEEEPELDEMKSVGKVVTWESKAGKVWGIVKEVKQSHTIEGLGVELKESNSPVLVMEAAVKKDDVIQSLGLEVAQYAKDVQPSTDKVKEREKRLQMKMDSPSLTSTEDEDGNPIGIIEGYASTYGNIDLGGDVVEKGAFNQFLNQKGQTKMLFDHGYYTSDVAGVAKYSTDDNGLKMVGRMPLNIPKAKECYDLIKFLMNEGETMGLSIGYEIFKADFDEQGIYHLRELGLRETSITPFPMNEQAKIQALKSTRLQEIANWRNLQLLSQGETNLQDQVTVSELASIINENFN